jgi:hypothetical protein
MHQTDVIFLMPMILHNSENGCIISYTSEKTTFSSTTNLFHDRSSFKIRSWKGFNPQRACNRSRKVLSTGTLDTDESQASLRTAKQGTYLVEIIVVGCRRVFGEYAILIHQFVLVRSKEKSDQDLDF